MGYKVSIPMLVECDCLYVAVNVSFVAGAESGGVCAGLLILPVLCYC